MPLLGLNPITHHYVTAIVMLSRELNITMPLVILAGILSSISSRRNIAVDTYEPNFRQTCLQLTICLNIEQYLASLRNDLHGKRTHGIRRGFILQHLLIYNISCAYSFHLIAIQVEMNKYLWPLTQDSNLELSPQKGDTLYN